MGVILFQTLSDLSVLISLSNKITQSHINLGVCFILFSVLMFKSNILFSPISPSLRQSLKLALLLLLVSTLTLMYWNALCSFLFEAISLSPRRQPVWQFNWLSQIDTWDNLIFHLSHDCSGFWINKPEYTKIHQFSLPASYCPGL